MTLVSVKSPFLVTLSRLMTWCCCALPTLQGISGSFQEALQSPVDKVYPALDGISTVVEYDGDSYRVQ